MTQLRLADLELFKRRYRQVAEDAEGLRPSCVLVTNLEPEDVGDGTTRIWVCFFCVDHSTSWRELCAVLSADAVNVVLHIITGRPCPVAPVGVNDTDDVR